MSTTLRNDIEELQQRYDEGLTAEDVGEEERAVLEEFLEALEAGEVRAAEKRGSAEQSSDGSRASPGNGEWVANEWVKQGILLNFGLREIETHTYGGVDYHDVLPLRATADLPERGTRNTPDGTVVRRGAYVGSDAIMMSPSFVNVGAYVGDGTLVDSCDTVGSAAQIGDGVKLGANTLVGGVLEPVEAAPVIIEDGVSLGAGCRVTSGFVVGEGSVVGENTLLTPRIPVYDLVEEEVVYGRLPPERRAFTRFVESSVGEHDLFEGGASKPAVVATDVEAETLEATRREDALRDN
jgi:2,3,4,5-tetrahydropyridine-2-carboxylate N-succinyltransferase